MEHDLAGAPPRMFPPKNPFEKMGLQSTSREKLPHANFTELAAFRATAIEMGYPSLATGVLIGWEWLQRKAHIFIRFIASTTVRTAVQTTSMSSTTRPARAHGALSCWIEGQAALYPADG